MHGDQLQYVQQRHDGIIPASWGTGNPEFRKAKVLAAVAWHYTKDPTDPELADCQLAHQENCIAIAESIIGGNDPDSTPFAHEVARLWAEVNSDTPKGELTP